MDIFCNRCGFSSREDAQFCQQCGAPLVPQSFTSPPDYALPAVSPYAGFWIRVLATLIDTVLLLAVTYLRRLVFGSAVTVLGMGVEMSTHKIMYWRRISQFAIGVVIGWLYKAGMESSRFQATLGKMVCRLKVTDLQGGRITFLHATARYFSKYLSTLTFGIGYLMVAFDEQKQGLHDRVARTLVLRR